MFKLPVLPASTGQKRKFTDAPSPGSVPYPCSCPAPYGGAADVCRRSEMLKKYRAAESELMAPPPIPNTNGKAKPKAATVSDEGEEEEASARGMFDDRMYTA